MSEKLFIHTVRVREVQAQLGLPVLNCRDRYGATKGQQNHADYKSPAFSRRHSASKGTQPLMVGPACALEPLSGKAHDEENFFLEVLFDPGKF